MNLQGYMALHGLSTTEMAERLTDALDQLGRGEDDPIISGIEVARWRRGAVGPSIRHAAAFFIATGGQVTPVDLYHTLQKARAGHDE